MNTEEEAAVIRWIEAIQALTAEAGCPCTVMLVFDMGYTEPTEVNIEDLDTSAGVVWSWTELGHHHVTDEGHRRVWETFHRALWLAEPIRPTFVTTSEVLDDMIAHGGPDKSIADLQGWR